MEAVTLCFDGGLEVEGGVLVDGLFSFIDFEGMMFEKGEYLIGFIFLFMFLFIVVHDETPIEGLYGGLKL